MVVTIVAACSTTIDQPGSGSSPGRRAAQVSFAISGGDFSGNSVRICGSRTPSAEAKFRCFNSLNDAFGLGETDPCPCFTFDAEGNLSTDTSNGVDVSAGIPHLCPTEDVSVPSSAGDSMGQWTFTYQIFTNGMCDGNTVLNADGNPNNFVCYDSQDLVTRDHPNESVEALSPGPNANHVFCSTVDAQKTFTFLNCERTCGNEPEGGGTNGVPCLAPITFSGCCELSSTGVCVCNGEPVPMDALEEGCEFDLNENCDIVCTGNGGSGGGAAP